MLKSYKEERHNVEEPTLNSHMKEGRKFKGHMSKGHKVQGQMVPGTLINNLYYEEVLFN
jgi:hypothetical protein